jgi:hypothetical protein
MSEQVAERVQVKRRVRVWFGSHIVAQYVADPEHAERYAHAMARRFAGLRVTNEPLPSPDASGRPLPSERLWDTPPH